MGKDSKIEWCHHTWNPWQGCHKVSPGCKNCYMFRDKKRFGQDPNQVNLSTDKTFFQPDKLEGPARVFVCSWSDFFLEEADGWRPVAWEVMYRNSILDFLLLTKRPERIDQCLPSDWDFGYWKNIWLGVSAENQEMYEQRWSILSGINAAIKFISVEPMLGPINLGSIPGAMPDWVICGCESGSGARVTELQWVMNLRDQCILAGIPFFLKQLRTKQSFQTMPPLDGQVWDQMPGR